MIASERVVANLVLIESWSLTNHHVLQDSGEIGMGLPLKRRWGTDQYLRRTLFELQLRARERMRILQQSQTRMHIRRLLLSDNRFQEILGSYGLF